MHRGRGEGPSRLGSTGPGLRRHEPQARRKRAPKRLQPLRGRCRSGSEGIEKQPGILPPGQNGGGPWRTPLFVPLTVSPRKFAPVGSYGLPIGCSTATGNRTPVSGLRSPSAARLGIARRTGSLRPVGSSRVRSRPLEPGPYRSKRVSPGIRRDPRIRCDLTFQPSRSTCRKAPRSVRWRSRIPGGGRKPGRTTRNRDALRGLWLYGSRDLREDSPKGFRHRPDGHRGGMPSALELRRRPAMDLSEASAPAAGECPVTCCHVFDPVVATGTPRSRIVLHPGGRSMSNSVPARECGLDLSPALSGLLLA